MVKSPKSTDSCNIQAWARPKLGDTSLEGDESSYTSPATTLDVHWQEAKIEMELKLEKLEHRHCNNGMWVS